MRNSQGVLSPSCVCVCVCERDLLEEKETFKLQPRWPAPFTSNLAASKSKDFANIPREKYNSSWFRVDCFEGWFDVRA